MKRRATSLALIFCLLLSTLAPLALAEDVPQPEIAAEQIETEGEFIPEAEPIEEAPVEEEAPIEEEAPGEVPSDEIPAEDELPIEDGAIEADPPVEALPEELPDADSKRADLPNLDEDLYAQPALGSANVQYAGVSYLSRAAYEGMSDAAREFYIRGVDEITALLDRGVPIYDVTFAMAEDGDISCRFTLPAQSSQELVEAEENFAEDNEVFAEAEEVPKADNYTQEVPAEALDRAANSSLEPAYRAENMELLRSLEVPIRRVNPVPLSKATQYLAGVSGLEDMRDLYEASKSLLYNNFDATMRRLYDAFAKSILEDGYNGFEIEITDYDYIMGDCCAVFNAAFATYAWRFDWMDNSISPEMRFDMDGDNFRMFVGASIGISDYYTPELETKAQAKAENLVNKALASAKKSYPHDLAYGMCRYFDEWICANNYYNNKGADMSLLTHPTEVFYYCHSGYGTLLKGYGVCESYARSTARFLDTAGIPSLYVVGYANGDHAWNHVQMVNEKYYMLDTTWDDRGSTSRQFMLCGKDSRHKPTGMLFDASMKPDLPALAKGRYTPSKGPVTLNNKALLLHKGASATLKVTNSAYKNDKKSWSSSDAAVAKVKNGKVTAVGPGSATITVSAAGQKSTCEVRVFQVDSITFEENGESAFDWNYLCEGELEPRVFGLQVTQSGYLDSAENIDAMKDYRALSFSSSNTKVAKVSAKLTGDRIDLTVAPVAPGDSTIKVSFGGKTATLNLQLRRALREEWFTPLEFERAAYTGRAFKPRVTKTAAAPADLKFSVSYLNNVNAGEATVVISGKKGYGTLERHFTIDPVPLSGKLTISQPKAALYCGAGQSAALTVKLGKKKLKAGADYEIEYDGSTELPVNVGSYRLRLVGKNYVGELSDGAERSFTIQPVPIAKLKLTLGKATVAQSGAPVTPEALGLKLKYGKKLIPETDYTVSFRDAGGNEISAPSAAGKYMVVVTPVGENIATSAKKTEIAKSFKIKK